MLQQALRDKGITHAELARRIGRHRVTVTSYVSGARPLPYNLARLISFSTGIPLSSILPEREEVKA